MSFILLGILNSQAVSGGGANYWLTASTDSGSLGNLFFWGTSGNLIVNGQTNISSNQAGIIAKLNEDGTINWQKTFANTTGDRRVFGTRGVVSDNTNHFAMYQDESTGNSDLIIAKFSDTPTVSTQRRYGGPNNLKVDKSDITADSSYNIAGGGYYETANNEVNFAVWNSSLTLQWQRRIDPNTGAFYDPRFRFDSSGNLFVAMQWNDSPTEVAVLKYNSSGTLQWQRKLASTSDLPQVAVTTDSSDNVYVSYRDETTSGWGAGLAKWNSSGTLQWQKTLSRSGWNYNSNANLVYGTDGNIYAAHTLNDGGTSRIFIVSYDTSGNVNWQRYVDYEISGSNKESIVYSLSLNANGDLVLACGTFDNTGTFTRYGIVMVLPKDGDFVANYDNGTFKFIGEAGSHSLTTTSYTGATSSFTVGTASRTEASSSLSLASITLNEQKVTIG